MNKNKIIDNLYSLIDSEQDFDFNLCKDLINYYKNKKIVIYGAGSAGKHLLKIFNSLNIDVIFFVDKNIQIKEISNIQVHSMDIFNQFKNHLNDFEVIIAVNTINIFENIEKDLLNNFADISYSFGLKVNKILSFFDCYLKYINNKDINLKECFGCRSDMAQCKMFNIFAKKDSKYNEKSYPIKSTFNDLSYLITTRCTYSCEHCTLKIPYLNKFHVDSQTILSDIKKVADNSNFISRLSLLGGELFLNKDLLFILKELLIMDSIGYIFIYTTGTILPTEELLLLLSNKRISLNISDYGNNSSKPNKTNLTKFINLMNKYNISYNLLENKVWVDLGNFSFIGNQIKKKSFLNCPFYSCITMIQGKIFRCPHQLAGITLGKIDVIKGDYVDIHKSNNLIHDLNNFTNLEFIDACNYCELMIGAKEVEAAIQIKRS